MAKELFAKGGLRTDKSGKDPEKKFMRVSKFDISHLWKNLKICLKRRAGLTRTEINQKLPLHLINNKDFQDLTEKFLISQATAYPLPTSCRNTIQSLGV
ncbi:hypothetical protein Celaphus_00002101 [Cervus elaphus hippelaphus]|uniref:Uncharacterized protein n=1 Tax=Cervus elaphus hippelaphus TaxID=46360 RepID=A0A212CFZ9_CEREH|nr:hypothetical protein Celaphus_00002101 [Cervus elaphus hippelaphus]